MTRRRLLATATAVAIAAAIAVGSLAPTSWAGASSTAATQKLGPAEQYVAGSIVVIGTGGLAWSDVSAKETPALWSLLRYGATATMSVRSVHASTCPVDGWLSLSAGERAGDLNTRGLGDDRDGPDGAKPACQALPDRMTAGRVPHWDDYQAAAAANRFGASLGLLGDLVAGHDGCIQAIGPGAALGAARANGIVDRYQPYDDATLGLALASCQATLVDVGAIRDPADVDPQDQSRPTTTRAQQVSMVDARVAAVLKAAPSGTDVALASLADAGATARLRLMAASGPDFVAGTLRSTSTRQLGLVQLADLTPTILEKLSIPRPPSLGGAPLQFVPADGNSEQSAMDRLRALLDYDEASHEVRGLVEPFFFGLILLQLALYLSALVLLRLGRKSASRRGFGTIPGRRELLRLTRQVAVVAASVPASTFLANLLPWWRFPVPLVSLVVSVGVFTAGISALALLGPWRRRPLGPVAVVCVATMVVLAADVMTGSRLQLSSLMGEQPVVGGRFYGMGNVTFALFATATLMLCTAVASYLAAVRQPRAAAVTVAFIGLVAITIDAAPSWGSDFGGPPALLPGLTLLILATLKIKVTWRRLLVMGGGTAVFMLTLGLLDWLRPAESRSHLGKFVQTAFDGAAWDIIARKLNQNLSLLLGNRLLLLVPVGLILLAYILARPTSRVARPMRRSFERVPLLRSGLVAVLVMWAIGLALNDSGAAIPAVGGTLALPLVISIAVRMLEGESLEGPATTRAARLRR